MDKIVVLFSQPLDEHFVDIKRIFNRLRNSGISLKLSLRPFASKKVDFLRFELLRREIYIKQRADLETLQETVVIEVTFARKKLFFVANYRSPLQSSDQFQTHIESLQMMLDLIRNETPYAIVLTCDFNCRSSQ